MHYLCCSDFQITNGQAGFDHLPSIFVKLSRAVSDRKRQEDTLKEEMIGWCVLLWAASFLLYFIATSIP